MCVARAELQLLALAARLGIAGAKPFKRGDAVCESLSGRSVLGAEVGLKNTSDQADGYCTKPDYRPLTKFENRGIKLGHGVWDLVFQRA